MTDAERLREVLVAPRHAFVPVPGLQVIERPGWLQLVYPALRHGGLNEVAHAELGGDEADAVIDATIAQYARLGLRFRWVVGPDSRPADLGARLARRGMRRELAIGVCLDLGAARAPVVTPTLGVRVERVGEAELEVYTRVMAEGWAMDPAPLLVMHRAMLAETPVRSWLYLASIDGVPAGVGAAMLMPASVYLIGSVVLPPLRGRGVYRALVAARLADARAAGRTLVTCRARAGTSAPILTALGFDPVCELEMYWNR